MCRNTFMLYQWCHCYEDVEYITCNDQTDGKCSAVTDDPIRMYCYCRYHAANKWNSVNKAEKKQAKLEKKKRKSGDFGTSSSGGSSPRSSFNSSLASSRASSTNNSTVDVTTGTIGSPHSPSRRRLSMDWMMSRTKLWRRST